MSIQEEHRQTALSEEALLGLVRLLKALSFYPSGHTSLRNAVQEAQKGFDAVLDGGDPLVLTVRRKELRLSEDLPVGPNHPALAKLASLLFDRRVQTLTFLPGLCDRDLLSLANGLRLDPALVQQRGGFPAVLDEDGIASIAVNETDISALLRRREEMESAESGGSQEEFEQEPSPVEEEQPAADPLDPLDLLDRLGSEDSDYRFRQDLEALLAFIREHLDEAHRDKILETFDVLLARSAEEERPSRREEILRALRELATPEVLHFFVQSLLAAIGDDALQKRILRILLFYRKEAVASLMEHLASENDQNRRRICLKALARLAKTDALPVLLAYLEDERWSLVLDTVALLGHLRIVEATAHLRKTTGHPDIRVRRESIRALTRIGGDEALHLLLDTLQGSDTALKLQALLSLGALRNPAAAPTLIRLIQTPDRWMKELEIRKGAIKALGEIGSPEAIPLLLKILRERRLWQRKRVDELRAAAASALGGIASDEVAAALKGATEDSSPLVARAAVQALKNFRKDVHDPDNR